MENPPLFQVSGRLSMIFEGARCVLTVIAQPSGRNHDCCKMRDPVFGFEGINRF